MPYTPSYLTHVLTDKEIRHIEDGKEILFKRIKIGELAVNGSEITACDPLVCPDAVPFSQKVPSGLFPVYLSIAHLGTDQRVAFAALIFSAKTICNWQMAVQKKQDVSTLKPTDIFGYGVDSGTGCFMDSHAATLLNERMQKEDEYYEVIIAEMKKTYVHTWSWASIELSSMPRSNLLAFSTGYGDGMYASYFGKDESGQPVALVTDFGLVHDKSGEVEGEVAPKPSRWRFWKK